MTIGTPRPNSNPGHESIPRGAVHKNAEGEGVRLRKTSGTRLKEIGPRRQSVERNAWSIVLEHGRRASARIGRRRASRVHRSPRDHHAAELPTEFVQEPCLLRHGVQLNRAGAGLPCNGGGGGRAKGGPERRGEGAGTFDEWN